MFCGLPIPDHLASPHPASRTLEHLQPKGAGGDMVDRANVRAAHRRCNELRHPAFTLGDDGASLVQVGGATTPQRATITARTNPTTAPYCADCGTGRMHLHRHLQRTGLWPSKDGQGRSQDW